MIGGRIAPEPAHATHIHALFMHGQGECCQETREALARLWHVEPVQGEALRPVRLTHEEKEAEELFIRTLNRLKDGRYEVGLLWKSRSHLPTNYAPALEAFYALERQMKRHPEMRNQFVKTVSDWLNKNIAHYVPSSSINVRYLIPTFMVIRLDKATTSYRLVVDGARKFNGTCINDHLLTGPKLIQSIWSVLIRFRQNSHAFTCDINAMYLNVKVPVQDQPFLCMFYREMDHHPIRVLQLSSHPFGLSSSPFVAMRVVAHHAADTQSLYPLAAAAVKENVIVDDFILSHDDPQQLYTVRSELEAMLAGIGMQVHKMAANHPLILRGVSPEKIAQSKELGEEDLPAPTVGMPTIKTLGLVWSAREDTLTIQFQPKYKNGNLTLRQIVSDGGRLYDLLGLGLPISMTCRILQQLCWSSSRGWDDPVPAALQDKWKTWSRNTEKIGQICIPRAVKTRNQSVQKQRLLVCVDASAEAQAAAVYVQTLYGSGE